MSDTEQDLPADVVPLPPPPQRLVVVITDFHSLNVYLKKIYSGTLPKEHLRSTDSFDQSIL